MSAVENPAAFPVSTIDGFTQHGMELRDHFAGIALLGNMSNESVSSVVSKACAQTKLRVPDFYARAAYEMADAMLRARASATSGEGV